MPLLKLRLKEEQALASPELCRQAPKDNPQALLAAANFADLVGIVRQLGELSDYAAVVFYQLHAESSKIGGRGDALARRVKVLEEKMPGAEARVLTAQSARQLLPNPGIEWHATPQMDQNLFTRTELPPYISEAYIDAQPPPPLHELDRFDEKPSDGVTLRRFSDPSFFKREWALAELAQAEKEKKARKAKRRAKHVAEQRQMQNLKDAAQAKQSRSRRSFSFGRTPTHALSSDNSPLFTPENPKLANPLRYSVELPKGGKHSGSVTPEQPSVLTPATQGSVSPYVESGVNTPAFAGETSLGSPETQLYEDSGENAAGFVEKKDLAREHADVHRHFDHSVADLLSSVGGVESQKTNGDLPSPDNRLLQDWADESRKGGAMAESLQHEKSDLGGANSSEADMHGRLEDNNLADLESGQEDAIRPHINEAITVESAREAVPRAQLVEDSASLSGREVIPRAQSVKEGALENAREDSPRAPIDEAAALESARQGSLHTDDDFAALESGREEIPRARRRSSKVFKPPENEPDFPRVESFDSMKQAARVREQLRQDSGAENRPESRGGDDEETFLSADGRSEFSALDAAWGASLREEEGRNKGTENGDSFPGSPENQGLKKLQRDYQQAQARLEQLLRMQQEFDEPPSNLETPLEAQNSAGTSLAVEPSLASRWGADSEEGHPPENLQTDTPPYSPLLEPPLTKSNSFRERSILDSPGPSFAKFRSSKLNLGSSKRLSKESFPSPYSSPERPWSLANRDEPFSNGGVLTPLPKPPPLPPPGSLAGLTKPSTPHLVTPEALSKSKGGGVDLMQAIAQHDRGRLKRVETQAAAPMPDSRNTMMEQIKRGVNLRRTEPVKRDATPVRPIVDSSVASILERANAIRQAVQDSEDEFGDDDSEVDWMD